MNSVNSFLSYLMPFVALIFVATTVIEMSLGNKLSTKGEDVLFRISCGTVAIFILWGFAGAIVGIAYDLKI